MVLPYLHFLQSTIYIQYLDRYTIWPLKRVSKVCMYVVLLWYSFLPLVPLMSGSFMHSMISSISKTSSTIFTDIRFVTRMDIHMIIVMLSGGKSFLTYWTNVRFQVVFRMVLINVPFHFVHH